MTDFSERNKIIVDSLLNGTKSTKQLAIDFKISHQRIFQIFYAQTGLQEGFVKELKKKRKLNKVKFICKGCEVAVTVGEGLHLHKYCKKCHKVSAESHRIMAITYNCHNCLKPYHPLAISVRNSKNKYCSHHCYLNIVKNERD